MIVVPIAGDQLKTKEGKPSKVLSYTNYKLDGPAVVCQPTVGTTETIHLDDIVELAGQPVKLIKTADGYNVLESDGFIERKFQLPQPGDTVTSDASNVETRDYRVNRIRLHVPDKLSSGLILDVAEIGSDETIELTLDQITDVKKMLFKRDKFLEYYSDYLKKGTAK